MRVAAGGGLGKKRLRPTRNREVAHAQAACRTTAGMLIRRAAARRLGRKSEDEWFSQEGDTGTLHYPLQTTLSAQLRLPRAAGAGLALWSAWSDAVPEEAAFTLVAAEVGVAGATAEVQGVGLPVPAIAAVQLEEEAPRRRLPQRP